MSYQDDTPEDLPVESRTAQFYQAGTDAAHPELVPRNHQKDKYAMGRSRLMAEHPYNDQPRLKVRLGGPSHTRVSQVPGRTTVAGKQEEYDA